MRFVFLVSAALCLLLWASVEAQGQAGRYIPVPRLPPGGGGMPQIPFFYHGSAGMDGDTALGLIAIVGLVILAVVGWNVGVALGRLNPPTPGPASSSMSLPYLDTYPSVCTDPPPAPASSSMSLPPLPPLEDLILQPQEVAEKARKTTRLLEMLSNYDAAFNPWILGEFMEAMFTRVQQCWEARDYGPIRELLGPSLLAEHEELLREMSRNGEINRIEDLHLLRLEFVHLWCPQKTNHQEVTALLTFEAKVFFVNERTGAFLRGSQRVMPFQEFWVFRRQGEAWRLVTIDRSHQSDRLTAANHVDGMTDLDRSKVEDAVAELEVGKGGTLPEGSRSPGEPDLLSQAEKLYREEKLAEAQALFEQIKQDPKYENHREYIQQCLSSLRAKTVRSVPRASDAPT